MSTYKIFKKYINFEYLTDDELKMAIDYICGNLNSYTRNYQYYYDMYSYTSKTLIVMQQRKEKGFRERGKLGEAICNDVLINFLQNKEHFNCTCSSVYHNAVF